MTRREILEQYEVNKEGVIRSPGKFEGEMLYAPYYYDHGQGDETWYSGSVEDAFAEVFRVTAEDRKEFPELGKTILVAVEEDDQGFVHLTEWTNQRKARQDQKEYEEREEEEENLRGAEAVRAANRRYSRRRNPGSRWHGEKASEAEEDRIRAEERGSIIGSHFYRGKREAHRESQDESRRMGLNPMKWETYPWETYAGGTAALPGKYSYVLDFGYGRYQIGAPTPSARSYRLYFVNTKGAKGGGLYQLIGDFRSPQAAKGAAKKHAQQWFQTIMRKKNPGAAWHQEQERLAEAMEKRETRPRRRTYLRGMADAHALSAHESRKLGMNPRGSEADATAARELLLFIENSEPLYRQMLLPVYANLDRKRKRGTYDREKAVKLFLYLADEGARRYNQEVMGQRGIPSFFTRATRLLVAQDLRDRYETEERKSLKPNPRGARTVVGRVFRAKRWAKRWARGRPVRRVKGGWQILEGSKRTPFQERAHRRKVQLEGGYGYVPGRRSRRRQVAKAMLERNPIAVYNPPAGQMIYSRVLAVEADQRPDGITPGNGYKGFRHPFSKASRVAAYALPDGSVLLKSAAGKRLWQDR